MRLLRMIAYALLGYVLYELFLGITEEPRSDARGASGAGAKNDGSSGKAKPVSTGDSDGGRAPRKTKRGAGSRRQPVKSPHRQGKGSS